ncbi:MAG: ATP-grasp domain-containing protein, partial [Deltaproteobacteria bacterium]|nr:ATP-grasp domain-containing protein [Deltaproteobacteria bacterium]
NADFADAVQKAGLIFIGPRASSIKSMGSKTGARQVMQRAGVPVVPGLTESSNSVEEAQKAAKKIGFPVMLKAAAGGGGRGMRKIDSLKDFESAYESAQSEARNSFGDDSVYIEKFLEQPRHIEVQVFADTHGNVISFPERECSVQRRHQKVIEESPSCFVNPNMRERMGEVARQAAQAVNYIGAGTVEFLVDAHKNFYFMEMNTRLQVEHPITEMISGFDLVEMQIQIAQGGLLTVKQDELKANGWAIEARVCAEDPDNNFLPTPGLIKHFKEPSGPYVRIDAAAYSGYQIPTEYDSMIGKVIAWAPTRKQAIKRLDRALSELIIKGCTTNISFLRQLLNFEEFLSGDYDTGLIGRFQAAQPKSMGDEHETIALLGAALFAYAQDKQPAAQNKQSPDTALSAWQLIGRNPCDL